MVGRVDMLDTRKGINHWKAKGLDFTKILYQPKLAGAAIRHCETQDHGLAKAIDHELMPRPSRRSTTRKPVQFEVAVRT